MQEIVTWILTAGYWVVCASVALRTLLLVLTFMKVSPGERVKISKPFALSIISEAALCALVALSFQISHVALIPITLVCFGLITLRKVAPFEKVATQHVYSFLASMMPKSQPSLAKATTLHLF